MIELPADAPIGTAFADYARLDDPVIDLSITPNRQDCMGVRGIARDLAAKGLGRLRPLDEAVAHLPAITPQGAGPDVRVEDAEGCPAFYAQAVRGVKNGPSPEWLQQRLKAVGQKPISALVDITNFVMLGLGRPLHVYDMASLKGGLVARLAKAGEQVLALNGKSYALDETMTVIADDAAVHDIGGIMGGEHSGAQDGTTDATRLVLALCGGTASEVTRAGTPPVEPKVVAYDPARCLSLAGVDVDAATQQAILEKLGFVVAPDWSVTVPSWRRDIDGAADLVEEVVRIHGIANVPSTPLPRVPGVAKPTATAEQLMERRARRMAAARGLNEAINWSFISEKEAATVGGGDWVLANPISEDLKVMRPSLLPGLLSAARRNADRGAASIRLFEVGRRYFRRADGSSDERLTVGVVMAGDKAPRGWAAGKAQAFTAYDAKAEALALLAAVGAPVQNLQMMGEAGAAYHPGQSGTLRLGPKAVLAEYGVLHPALAKRFDLGGTVVAVQIFLDAIPQKRKSGFMRPPYAPPALQSVMRDFAFLMPEGVEGDALVRAVKGADKKSIVDARLFDLFTGAGVDAGMKSLAIEVTLQPGEKSFTEEELSAISAAIVKAAGKLGGTLRG
ncbi:MAG: phenylalanine--tRNA ligase subunit beta [Sphingobium sp. 32-64-5]|nr:MAG: phenylalanine--tRNA ligase subunit beta [Sphingobium sp. 32-64-5]